MLLSRYIYISAVLLLLAVLLNASQQSDSIMPQEKDEGKTTPLLLFGEAQNAEWQIVNDGVMGGLSRGQLRTVDARHSAFEGVVSLANNGGFTSMVARSSPLDFSGYAGIRISARPCTPGFADRLDEASYDAPKTYALRLKIATSRGSSRFSYATRFRVPAPDSTRPMAAVDIPLEASAFTPVFRGRELSDVPGLDVERMQIAEIGFMISDKQEGAFCLEMAGVSLY